MSHRNTFTQRRQITGTTKPANHGIVALVAAFATLVAANFASRDYGGFDTSGAVTMNASTVASNTAGTSIGVFLQSAAVGRFVHASVVSNTAPAGAGIAFNGAGPHFFTSTLLGGAVTDQCAGTSTKRNFSILATDADCGLRTVSSVAVGPLGAYGGDLPICVSTALTQ